MPRTQQQRCGVYLSLCIILCFLCSCQPAETAIVVSPVAARAVSAQNGNIINTMRFSSNTQSTVNLAVTSMLGGRVDTIFVSLGEPVLAGQPLLQLEGDEVGVGVAQVKAVRDMAQANYTIASGGSSRAQLLQADGELSAATWAYEEIARVYTNMLEERGSDTPAQLLQLDSAMQLTRIAYEDAARQFVKMQRALEDPTVAPELIQLNASREVARLAYDEIERNYHNLSALASIGAVAMDQVRGLELQLNTTREQMQATETGYLTAVEEMQRGARLQLSASEEQWLLASQGHSSASTDALKQTEIQLAGAKLRLSTAQEVYALTSQQILPESVAAAEAQLQQAQAAYEQALLQQSRLLVNAPVSGIVTSIGCDPKAMIGTSTLLFTIADSSELYADIMVSEREALRLRGHDIAEVILGNETLPAAIQYTAQSPDMRTGLYRVRVGFSNPQNHYLIGQSCDVQVAVEQFYDVLILPRSAIVAVDDKSYVYVLTTDEADRTTAHQTEVTLGAQDPDNVHIVAGLHAGQVVANSAQSRLSDGAWVMPIYEAR